MARIYRHLLVAALVLAACGEATEPPGEWLEAGAAFTLTAHFATDYDCDPDEPGEADPSLCGGETGLVAVSRDTLDVTGSIDSVGDAAFGTTATATFTGSYTACFLVPTVRRTGCTTAPVSSTAEIRRISFGLCGDGVLSPCETDEGNAPVVTFTAAVNLSIDSTFNQTLLITLSGEADATGVGGTLTPSLGSGPVFVPQRQRATITWRLDAR